MAENARSEYTTIQDPRLYKNIAKDSESTAESRRAEQVGAYIYEFGTNVLEHWLPPGWVKFYPINQSAELKGGQLHCPEIMMIANACIYLDKRKQVYRLLSVSMRFPERFLKEGSEWHSQVFERHRDPLDISYLDIDQSRWPLQEAAC